MKITKSRLRTIIKEELENTLAEAGFLGKAGRAALGAFGGMGTTGAWARQAGAAMGHGKSKKGIEVLEAVMRMGNTLDEASRRYWHKLKSGSSREDLSAYGKGDTVDNMFSDIKNLPQLKKDVAMIQNVGRDDVTEAVLMIANEARNLWDKLMGAQKTGAGTDTDINALHRGMKDLIDEFGAVAMDAEEELSGYLGGGEREVDPDASGGMGLGPSAAKGKAYTESRKRRLRNRKSRK